MAQEPRRTRCLVCGVPFGSRYAQSTDNEVNHHRVIKGDGLVKRGRWVCARGGRCISRVGTVMSKVHDTYWSDPIRTHQQRSRSATHKRTSEYADLKMSTWISVPAPRRAAALSCATVFYRAQFPALTPTVLPNLYPRVYFNLIDSNSDS